MAPSGSFTQSSFAAIETELNGKRTIRLVELYKNNPKVINLIVQQSLQSFERFPAVYEFVDVPADSLYIPGDRRKTAVRIVAAPGVSVHLEAWPDDAASLLEVYRVQDPNALPPQATAIFSDFFTPPPGINAPSFLFTSTYSASSSQYPINYFEFEAVASGLVIKHPYSTYSLALEYPTTSKSTSDIKNAQTRFCYQVVSALDATDFQQMMGYGPPPTFTIVRTAAVNTSLGDGRPRIVLNEDSPLRQRQFISPFRVYEVSDISKVPPQGKDLTVQSDWKDVTTQTRRVRDWFDEESYRDFRVIVSMLPAVPVILDIGEFAYACGTGKDFRGRELSDVEKAMLGLAVVVDFVLMSAPGVFKVFKRKVQDMIRLRQAIKAANITPEERAVIKEVGEIVARGKTVPKPKLETITTVLKRVQIEYPPIETLLNADETGFAEAELQAGYEEYVSKSAKRNAKPSPPKEWAKSQNSGQYSDKLVKLLGPDFRKTVKEKASAAASRIFNIAEIMRPHGYTDEVFSEHLKLVLAQRDYLADQLRPLFAALGSADESMAFLARTQISGGRLSNLKGEIGELFALPIQIQTLQEKYPEAVLLTGVRMQRVGAKVPVKFTDNVIAIIKGNDIELKVVWEVKSGDRGGAEATTQIFEWIENRLADGDQLIIPKGSKYYDAKGTAKVLENDIRAYYKKTPSAAEAAAGIGRARGLANAARKIIAAKGTSELGLKSADQIGPEVERLILPISSSELDFLSGQVVQELGR